MTAIGTIVHIDGEDFTVDEVWPHGAYAVNAAGERRWVDASN